LKWKSKIKIYLKFRESANFKIKLLLKLIIVWNKKKFIQKKNKKIKILRSKYIIRKQNWKKWKLEEDSCFLWYS
jgi:hypothetical protein